MLLCFAQLIACGDFKQLPPVPDSLHLDPGDYCFEAEEFKKALPHKVILKQVCYSDHINNNLSYHVRDSLNW